MGDEESKDSASPLRKLFIKARKISEGLERERFLENACGDDLRLRQDVESLLGADDASNGFLDDNAAGAPVDLPEEGLGTLIGRYRILEEIGEGAFGRVFMAEQTEPVRRKVALKIIKAGMDTKAVVTRFEAERQALALMDHPNIARILDAGTTDRGRPYFVMELVRGLSITDYCDRNNLPTSERLSLFLQVCQAVQHAHQKGIIHRDLKPSNILVTMVDGEPVSKTIDFGVAKALGHQLTAKTLFTAFTQVIGTPAYMSPEQAEFSGVDADTRSDIYSLGVLLYELLTGATPIDVETLRRAGIDEIRRLLRETDPPKPSARLRTLGEELTEAARHRQVEPSALAREVHGDLDWIVMKALDRDRGRRYEAAGALAQDVQRHLEHRPVLAGPPNAVYRMRKFVRRHRTGVAAATAALSFGLVVSLVAFGGVRRERDRAVAAEAKAREEAASSEAIRLFLQRDLLQQAAPFGDTDRDVKLRTVLDRAAESVGNRFQDKPLLEAEIRLSLAEAYGVLGEHSKARIHLDRALDIHEEHLPHDSPRYLEGLRRSAPLLDLEGRHRDSQLLLEHLLPLYRRLYGSEHHRTLSVMRMLGASCFGLGDYAKGQELTEAVLSVRRRVSGPAHYETLVMMNACAIAYHGQGKLAKAHQLLEEAVAGLQQIRGPRHQALLTAKSNLADIYSAQGRLAETAELSEELLPLFQEVFGDEHPKTLGLMHNLSVTYDNQGRQDEFRRILRELLPLMQRVLDPEHPDVLTLKCNLALNLARENKLAAAQELYNEVLEARHRVLGPEHPQTLLTKYNLAFCYHRQGRPVETVKLLEEVLAIRRRVSGEEHMDTLSTMHGLAWVYSNLGRWVEARELWEKAVSGQRRVLGREHPSTAGTMNDLAWMLATCAEPSVRDGPSASHWAGQAVEATDHSNVSYLDTLAAALAEEGQFDRATEVAKEAISLPGPEEHKKGCVSRLQLYESGIPFREHGQVAELARDRLGAERYAEAEVSARECLAIREVLMPDDWRTYASRSLLGGSLLGQNKYAEAEPMLLAAYRGMAEQGDGFTDAQRQHLLETTQRLVQLCEETHRPDQTAAWRAKLAQLQQDELGRE